MCLCVYSCFLLASFSVSLCLCLPVQSVRALFLYIESIPSESVCVCVFVFLSLSLPFCLCFCACLTSLGFQRCKAFIIPALLSPGKHGLYVIRLTAALFASCLLQFLTASTLYSERWKSIFNSFFSKVMSSYLTLAVCVLFSFGRKRTKDSLPRSCVILLVIM